MFTHVVRGYATALAWLHQRPFPAKGSYSTMRQV
jgi:hypothetical protein